MVKGGGLRLPCVLQQQLGDTGGGGGVTTGKKRRGGKAGNLSRKEKRKQERLEKKQRKGTVGKRSREAEEPPILTSANGSSSKRPRIAIGSTASTPTAPAAATRKSIGLLEKARSRGAAAASGSAKSEKKLLIKKKEKKTSSSLMRLEPAKDPCLAAEEEELRYLERKLGLTGADKKKKEEKLFCDLMKYEGFDDSICDLLRATDQISEMVSKAKKKKEEGKEKKDGKGKKADAARTKGLISVASRSKEGSTYDGNLASGESDLEGGEEEEGDDNMEEEEEEGEGEEDDDDGGGGMQWGYDEIPDFLENEGEEEEGEGEKDDDGLEPLEVEVLDDDDESEEGESEEGEEQEVEVEEDEDEDEEEKEEGEEEEEDDEEEEDGVEQESEEVAKHAYRPVEGEDIYGRPTNAAAAAEKGGKYVPPHLRKLTEVDTSSEDYQRLRKIMNGLANRLSESNLEPTIRDLRALYQSHSSQRVNTLLTETMLYLCVSSTQVMKGLVPTYAALIAGAHFAAGGGAGAFVLERVCNECDDKRKKLAAGFGDHEDGKAEESLARELDNLVLILAFLYSFGVVASGLIYELIRELVEAMGERDVELLLLLLRSAGHQLRSDDPAALKDIVLLVQERAAQMEAKARKAQEEGDPSSSSAFSARVKHMLETINDLKNNKRRQAQLQDQDRTTRLKKLVQHARNSQKGASGGETLHITWSDLRASDERGRWWRVGASWTGKQANGGGEAATTDSWSNNNRKKAAEKGKGKSSSSCASLQDKMDSLASKQRMNTDVRRSIFCAIMTATDYEDAFERLMRLNLTDQQEREIVRVLIDCAGQEPSFNPFYAYVAGRLCEYHDKYKFTLQLTFWDLFKLLDDGESMPIRRSANLSKTLAHFVQKGWLTLSVIKVVDISQLSPTAIQFFRSFFTQLLEESSDAEVMAAVYRVGQSKDPITLSESITAFLHRHMIENEEGGKGGGGSQVISARRKKAKAVVKLLDKLSVSSFMNGPADD